MSARSTVTGRGGPGDAGRSIAAAASLPLKMHYAYIPCAINRADTQCVIVFRLFYKILYAYAQTRVKFARA
jgi:hypothetical protein